MPGFFDYGIADEVHELKGDTRAQAHRWARCESSADAGVNQGRWAVPHAFRITSVLVHFFLGCFGLPSLPTGTSLGTFPCTALILIPSVMGYRMSLIFLIR